jgi:hypothetical protein
MARQAMVLLYVNEEQAGMRLVDAHCLDGASRGYSLDDPVQERLGRKLDQQTSSNKDTVIAVFCVNSDCWLSYNTTAHCAPRLP